MMLLHDVDKPGSDIEEYLDSLDAILAHKVDIITHLSKKIKDFR
jgi:kinesin family protein 2/24